MQSHDTSKLRSWFLSQSRDLPWRTNPTPYSVWVSEVMLQQTQVSVVIPYFERWMQQFPSIEILAQTPVEKVIKAWEGLGYYSRARNLHEGAKYVLSHFDGQLPDNAKDLLQIKGLGQYTVGAILNFAFHQKAAAVDGNVLRVLARYYGLSDDIAKSKTVKKFQLLTDALLPDFEPWVISEALIELGATVCTKQPKCGECPLKLNCKAFKEGLTASLPVKSGQAKTTYLYRSVGVIFHGDHILVKKGSSGKVMADLYEFPFVEMTKALNSPAFFIDHFENVPGLRLTWKGSISEVKHSFTRYQALLIPHIFDAEKMVQVQSCEWIRLEQLKEVPFSSGHRRIFATLQSINSGSVVI